MRSVLFFNHFSGSIDLSSWTNEEILEPFPPF